MAVTQDAASREPMTEPAAYSATAEQAVIGAMLIDAACVPDVLEKLRSKDFYFSQHAHFFEAMRTLFSDGKPIDPVTTLARLRELGLADESAPDYVADLMRNTPTAANVLAYAEIVRENARLRALHSIGYQLAYECHSSGEALTLLTEAGETLASSQRAADKSWQELLHGFFEDLNGPPPKYLDLGIAELTRAARVRPGHFVVLGAENSTGKTALALQMAVSMARKGTRVGFFSLETDPDELTQRIIAQQAGLPMFSIQDHLLSDADMRKASDAANELYELPIELIPAAGFTAADIRAKTLALRLDAVFIDYVQLIEGDGDNPVMQLRAISIALHTMAQRLGVTVFALSQITLPQVNKNTGRRAEISKRNLNMSSQLANDANVVLLMYLSDPDDYTSTRVLKMDKNKNAGQGRMLLAFDGPRLRFSYQPNVEEIQRAKDADRFAKMDSNRAERKKKKASQAADADAQESAFEALESGALDGQIDVFTELCATEGGDLPF